jgi:hypothetical protein
MMEGSGVGSVLVTSVADPDPGSGAFWPLDPGSGMGFFRIPDPNPIFLESLVTIFWVKSFKILWKLAQIFFLQHFKNKIIYNFVKFVGIKKGLTKKKFSTPPFSWGFWIRDPGWVKIRIRDPG